MMRTVAAPGKVFDAPSDGDEVRAFLSGDGEAFERLVDRHQRSVLLLCQRLLGTSEAQDLFQEVFLQAYRALPQLRAPDAFRTWLFRIAVRKARRRMGARAGTAAAADPELLPAPERDDPLVQDEEIAQLRRALALLPPRQREVVVLRHYHGLGYAELAEMLEISEENARANHYQGLRRLRQELAPRSGVEQDEEER